MTDSVDQIYMSGAAAAGKTYMARTSKPRDLTKNSMVSMVPYSFQLQELDL
jgi:hypothetical protein